MQIPPGSKTVKPAAQTVDIKNIGCHTQHVAPADSNERKPERWILWI